MNTLRSSTPYEEFDYLLLMDNFRSYKKPRDKVTRHLKNGDIIRIKKGLYIFGDSYRKGPVYPEILANLIYGPSYISCEFALSSYGIIPEAVRVITSVTTEKNKEFETILGTFKYKHLKLNRYLPGKTMLEADAKRKFLIATKEKALADTLFFSPRIDSVGEMLDHLTENLRIDLEITDFNLKSMKDIALAYDNHNVQLLYEALNA